MEVYVDDSRVDDGQLAGGTVETAVHLVQSTICAPGHMVVGLRCDGQDVPAGEMSATLSKPASEVDRLDVLTSSKGTLVAEAMEQSSASLEETVPLALQVADLLNEGKSEEARRILGDCVAAWQRIHLAIAHSVQMLGLDPRREAVNDAPFLDSIDALKNVLLEIKKALEACDEVMLADILHYEFGEATEKWQVIMDTLRQEAEQLKTADDST